MSSVLPRFVVIKSTYGHGKYLKRASKETFLNFSGEDIASPYIKFELEPAMKDPELVHIRCCSNYKYLSFDNKTLFIEATADNPIEEGEHTINTMFKAIKVSCTEKEQYFRFFHPKTTKYACLWNKAGDPKANGLCSTPYPLDDDRDVFKILDWESLVIFPKTAVAFKLPGNDNKYLRVNILKFLVFDNQDGICNETIANEISSFGDGYVRIKNLSTNQFWAMDPVGWIMANSSDTTGTDLNTLFWPVKLANNVVALRCTGNKFCQRKLSPDIYINHLFANVNVPTIMNEMKLEVVGENIMSSSTYGIRFNKDEGKVYNLNVVQKGYASAENTGREESTISLKFGYKKTYTSSFGTSYSLKLGAKTSVVCSVIPLIVEGKIEYTAESMYETHWEQTTTTETFIEVTYTAKVPANKKVTVTLEATEGMCDVPFSYTRRDILCNGNAVVHNMEDGIYKGVNLFNFNFKSNYESLPKGYNEKIQELTKVNQSID